jgi:hypothetical protein
MDPLGQVPGTSGDSVREALLGIIMTGRQAMPTASSSSFLPLRSMLVAAILVAGLAAAAGAQDMNWPDEYWRIEIPGGGSWMIWNNGCIYWGEGMAINGDIPWAQTLEHINDRPESAGGPKTLPPKAWVEKGRLLKIGPWDSSGLHITRLIRIAEDRLSIQWTDIVANDSNEDSPMGLMYESYTPLMENLVQRGDFKSPFTGREYAFIAIDKAGDKPWEKPWEKQRDAPAVLCHAFGSRGPSRLPDMMLFNKRPPGVAQVYSRMVLPAGRAFVFCFIQQQLPDLKAAVGFLKGLDENDLLRDVPASLHWEVLNLRPRWDPQAVPPRSDKGDRGLLWDGNSIFGTVQNKSFAVQAQMGQVQIPAESLLGAHGDKADPGKTDFYLADGQVIRGPCQSPAALDVALSGGGKGSIGWGDLNWFSFRLGGPRPARVPATGGAAGLSSGDVLAIDPNGLSVSCRIGEASFRLDAKCIADVETVDPKLGTRLVRFRNGGRLLCQLDDKTLSLATRLYGRRDVPLQDIGLLRFAEAGDADPSLVHIRLKDWSLLCGHLKGRAVLLTTGGQQASIPEATVRTLEFPSADRDGRRSAQREAVVRLWGGVERQGTIAARLELEVAPGSILTVPAEEIALLGCPQEPSGLPSDVEALIRNLGSPAFEAREAATRRLIEIGVKAASSLEKHAVDPDPEIRERVNMILKAIRGPGEARKPAAQ